MAVEDNNSKTKWKTERKKTVNKNAPMWTDRQTDRERETERDYFVSVYIFD